MSESVDMSEGMAPSGPTLLDGRMLEFLTWQCRLRKLAVREHGGRPSPGMCPNVTLADGTGLGSIIVLLVKRPAVSDAAELRFLAARTQDPAERYRRGLRFLQADYYLRPHEFAGDLLATFAVDSPTAHKLVAEKQCRLHFAEGRQQFELHCRVRELGSEEDAWQAAYWHNRLFNPDLNPDCRILSFAPDWAAS